MDDDRRDRLNRCPAELVGGAPADESEHFFVCPGCAQAVDYRKLGDVLHHAEHSSAIFD